MNKKYSLAIKIILASILIVIARSALTTYTDLSISLNPLYLSIVAGTIFLMGFVLAGVVADYKESEKIPGEIAASIENLYEEARYFKKIHKSLGLKAFTQSLSRVIDDLKTDISNSSLERKSILSISGLSPFFHQLDKLKVAPQYVTRMKNDRDLLRKNILRIYHIKQTEFAPAAYAVLEILTAGIILMMLFISIESSLESTLIPGLISFFLLYMIFLVRDMDDPFDSDSNVSVDLFLLDNLKAKLEKGQ